MQRRRWRGRRGEGGIMRGRGSGGEGMARWQGGGGFGWVRLERIGCNGS